MESALEKAYEVISQVNPRVVLLSVYRERRAKRKAKIFPYPADNPLKRLKAFINGLYSEGLYLFHHSLFENFRFNSKLKVREDWVLKGLIFALYKPVVIKEPLAIIRDHPQRLRKNTQYYLEATLLSVEELFSRLPKEFEVLKRFALGRAYMELGIKASHGRNYEEAFVYYSKAIKSDPKLLCDLRFVKKLVKSYLLKYFAS
ncbi:MAG: hypothetical protein ABDI07_10585 [Candidatus Kryptonium sp.]